ncbi:MAG: alpha/beta hydrolase [Micromonosporaceae bacterium]
MKRRPVVQHRTEVSYTAKTLHTLARLFVWPVLATLPITPLSTPLFGLVETAAARRRPPRWADVETIGFDGFTAEWVRADNVTDNAPGSGVVLYFHGGAFLFGGLATHRPVVASISRASGMPVLSVGYRHLPKVPLAGSVADCLTAYRWLLAQGTAPEHIVLAGDSAGGHLAFATALRAVNEGLPKPSAIVAVSPWLDLDCETKLSHPNSRRDAYAPAKRLPRLVHMLTEGVVPADPLLSPVNHDLSVLPPSLLIVAEGEMLRCDSELMAERLAAAGVPCTLQIWEGQVHAFPTMVGLVPEAGRSIREIGSFVRRHTGARATRRKAS